MMSYRHYILFSFCNICLNTTIGVLSSLLVKLEFIPVSLSFVYLLLLDITAKLLLYLRHKFTFPETRNLHHSPLNCLDCNSFSLTISSRHHFSIILICKCLPFRNISSHHYLLFHPLQLLIVVSDLNNYQQAPPSLEEITQSCLL